MGDWRLRFVGNGPLREALMARAASLGIGDARAASRRPVPSTQVPDQLRRLDVLVLPSLTRPNWKEQFGRVLRGDGLRGTGRSGSDSGEIPHVVGDGGSIVPEGDASALAAALQRLVADPEFRRELGQRGRARVLERFTQASVARRTVEVYRQMSRSLSPRKGASGTSELNEIWLFSWDRMPDTLGETSRRGRLMAVSDRARIRTHPERAVTDETAEIIEKGSVAHVGFVVDGQPFVIPMLYHFENDTVYIHGQRGGRLPRTLRGGEQVCVEVTLVDGLIASRDALYHSANYRSATVFGTRPRSDRPRREGGRSRTDDAPLLPRADRRR